MTDDAASDTDTADIAWSRKVASLAGDELALAGIVEWDDFNRAVEIAAEEIYVRLAMQDRPPS